MIGTTWVRRRPRGVVAPAMLLASLAGTALAVPTAAQTVHAVLFHSPTCPHCRQVIGQDLPVFFQVYGGDPTITEMPPYLALVSNGELEILFVDAAEPEGHALYEASLEAFPVAEDRTGVPRLIVGDSVLVGSFEIPTRLHAIIRAGLAAGGIPWPAIPGLRPALASVGAGTAPAGVPAGVARRDDAAPDRDTTVAAGEATGIARDDTARGATPSPAPTVPGVPGTAAQAETAGATGDTPLSAGAATGDSGSRVRLEDLAAPRPTTVRERMRRDAVGNGMAIAVLVIMTGVVAAIFAGVPARRGPRVPGLWMPTLTLVGAGVAAYLSYVETSGAMAVCGPVGDCNAVQQSPYAQILGVPIGILGLLGYGLVLVLWTLGQDGRAGAARARQVLVVVTGAGTLFSLYLTALEPFVIGATCAWCLSSALVMTALFWLAAAWPKVPSR